MSSKQHPSPLQIPDIIIYFICRIESSFPDERSSFVTTFCQLFIQRIDEHIKKPDKPHKQKALHSDKDKKYYTDQDIYNTIKNAPFQLILCSFIPYIIQNRFMCPFSDINNSFYKLIQHINKLDISIPQSLPPYPLSGFLQSPSMNLPHQSNTAKNDIYIDLYSKFGRINHLQLLLLSQGEYLRQYLDDFNHLFYALMYEKNGPLSLSKRVYLGLMAASRYSCKPIIMQCESRYMKLNGDITWIKSGITCAPSKYAKLAKLNALLAHEPWLITARDIADLLADGQLTVSQCIHAVIILVLYHFLSGMYHGLCLTPDIDLYYNSILHINYKQSQIDKNVFKCMDMSLLPLCGIINKSKSELEEDQQSTNLAQLLLSSHTDKNGNKIKIGVKVKKNEKDFEQSACINYMEFDPNMAPQSNFKQDLVINEEQKFEFEEKKNEKNVNLKMHEFTSSDWKELISIQKEDIFTNESDDIKEKKKKYKKIVAPKHGGTLYWKYSLGIDMIYRDFDCHNHHQIHAYDFNWDKHGYALLSRYYPGIEKKMDSVFKTAYTMTDHCINNKSNVDTQPFRIAVWHYTFRLYGVNNDSYEYRFVNVYLPVKLKIFIKKLVCYPQIITVDDFKKMGVTLKEKEKIHIAILALEAKKQASLLFGLRAIMKYIQSN